MCINWLYIFDVCNGRYHKKEYSVTENTFIIRIWCEHSEHTNIKPQFRGVVEHAISGERQYISGTKGISHFIQSQLLDEQNYKNHPNSINP